MSVENQNEWLCESESKQMAKILLAELATKFTRIKDFTVKTFTPTQNRIFILTVFGKISFIKDEVLKICQKKKEKMQKNGIFDEENNNSRIRSIFQLELSKRIKKDLLINESLQEVKYRIKNKLLNSEEDVVTEKSDVEMFKDTFQKMIKVTNPTVEDKYNYSDIQKEKQDIKERYVLDDTEESDALKLFPNFTAKFNKFANEILKDKNKENCALHSIRKAKKKLKNFEVCNLDNSHQNSLKDWEAMDSEFYKDDVLEISNEEKPKNSFYNFTDPLLSAHLENPLATLNRSSRRVKEVNSVCFSNNKRYLIPNPEITEKIKKMKLDIFDIQQEDEDFNDKLFFDDYLTNESFKNLPSKRKLKHGIELDLSFFLEKNLPGTTICDKENFDELVKKSNELEDIYEMVLGTMDTDIIFREEALNEIVVCPTAPSDPEVLINNLYSGFAENFDRRNNILDVKPADNDANYKLPPIRNKNQYKKQFSLNINKNNKKENDDNSEKPSLNNSIRLLTRKKGHVTVKADEFGDDRNKAMEKIISSKYGVLKYNYGGFIPKNVMPSSKLAKKNEDRKDVNFKEYLNYLRVRLTDFIFDYYIDKEEEDNRRKKMEIERKMMLKDEEEKNEYEKIKKEKIDKRKNMLRYQDGFWNAGYLQYMEEIHNRDIKMGQVKVDKEILKDLEFEKLKDTKVIQHKLMHDIKNKQQTVYSNEKDESECEVEITDNSKYIEENSIGRATECAIGLSNSAFFNSYSQELRQTNSASISLYSEDTEKCEILSNKEENLTTHERKPENNVENIDKFLHSSNEESQDSYANELEKPKSPLRHSESLQDVDFIQKQLEKIWKILKMPLDQKMDMVVKYSSPKFAKDVKEALESWKSASRCIIKREILLKKIEKFEEKYCDPSRLFEKGGDLFNASKLIRIEECKNREHLLKELHTLDYQTENEIINIKNHLKETVTYCGVPYLLKMKKDYQEILADLCEKRAQAKEKSERRLEAKTLVGKDKKKIGLSKSTQQMEEEYLEFEKEDFKKKDSDGALRPKGEYHDINLSEFYLHREKNNYYENLK
ncbi:Coiled-coil domain-containing protein 87 [Lobulomyces angularis]|nr:Coiled-coil domain-containing protein 87 [Lobulomyces angularis]